MNYVIFLDQWFSTGGAHPPEGAWTLSKGGASRLQDGRKKTCRNASGWTIITHKQIILLVTFFGKKGLATNVVTFTGVIGDFCGVWKL